MTLILIGIALMLYIYSHNHIVYITNAVEMQKLVSAQASRTISYYTNSELKLCIYMYIYILWVTTQTQLLKPQKTQKKIFFLSRGVA